MNNEYEAERPAQPPAPSAAQPAPPTAKPTPRLFPSLPGMPISDEEHNFLKASREKRAQKWEELRRLAAEIGATVSGYPTPSHPPHRPSQYAFRGERPSGLTIDQEVENERYYDDTERNTLHREQEIKKAAEAEAKLDSAKKHEVERGERDRKETK